MRYVFKVLILGNPDFSVNYLTTAFNDSGENRGTYKEWYKEINALDNVCDLEIDAITDLLSADFDDIIPAVDGIIYFLDPLNEEESDLFNMILPIIFSVKRDIPTIILFYCDDGVIPISTNELLEKVWVNFPNLEAFVNLFPNQFHQVLQCISLAMITGDTPLNIENAWMRYPIYLQLANFYFKNKNYYYAAQAIHKLSIIAEIYEKQEYFIFNEQSAFLFSKLRLFLEASNVLELTDPKLSNSFKKYYAEKMILEGNLLFNKNQYEEAALQYESAGQWASLDLHDKQIIKSAFELAINAWISACKCEKAFLILERLSHQAIVPLLENVSGKIIAAADFLVSKGNLTAAKEQLYYSILRYQRESLFEQLKQFVVKLLDVLNRIFEKAISSSNLSVAKSTFDEIENIWEAFKIKRNRYDELLEKLIQLAISDLEFPMAGALINKIESMELKKEISKFNLKKEEENKKLREKEKEKYVQSGIDILEAFQLEEIEIISNMNAEKIKKASLFIEQNDWLKAAMHIKTQADFLREIGKTEIENQILAKSLDILLEGKLYNEFFKYFSNLTEDLQKTYLKRVYPSFIEQLREIKSEKNFEESQQIFEKSNNIYRSHDLYEESKEISEILVELLKDESLRIAKEEKTVAGVKQTSNLIRKIIEISSAYLDSVKINFDDILKILTETCIYELNDLSTANAYNDRIENKEIKKKIHKIIAQKESEKSAQVARIAKDSIKGEFLKERFSIIEKKARDALHDKQNELKQRTGIKRAYFKDALINLKNKDFDKAIEVYDKSTQRLVNLNKYNMAAVSFAMSCLLLIKENKIEEIEELFDQNDSLFGNKLFAETFPVILINYLIDMKKIKEDTKFEEAILFLENLPLFNEEIDILYQYLGRERIQKEEDKSIEKLVNISDIEKSIKEIAGKIEKSKNEIGKRKIMKDLYWTEPLKDLSNGRLTNASIGYLDAFTELMNKDLYKPAALSLILGCLILMREKNPRVARLTLEKQLSMFTKSKRNKIKTFPEIQIVEQLISAQESKSKALIKLSYKILIDKLILFDPELDFLNQFSDKPVEPGEQKETLTRKERAQLSTYKLQLEQTFDNLQQKKRDIISDSKTVLNKRKAMRRHYYEDILTYLNKKQYKKASQNYLKLAYDISKRKDFKTSSLLILLHSLSNLKITGTIEDMKKTVETYLDSLGLNKPLVRETFEISLALFILDVKNNDLRDYVDKVEELLGALPLFDEEKELVKLW